jgi:RHS repeat-associated protein
MSVGWTKPNESTIEVIPGSVLTPFVAPNATPSLTASLASPTQINLSWTDNCTNEDKYRIERSVSGGPYSQIASLDPNTTSFQNTGLTANTAYSYRVRAYNSQGTSAWSNVFTLTTQEATSGVVVREVWTNLEANALVSSIPVNNRAPDYTTTLTSLREPSNVADYFGTRIRGYIQVPTSGQYTFWISSDDNSEMWLSADNQPANKQKIDSVIGWTDTLQWNKFPSQKSSPKNLITGVKYYFEILHKDAGGGDNLAVGWQTPNSGGTIQVIPASVLWKFVKPSAPSNLTAVAVSGTQINLSWSDNSDNEDNFVIEQSTNGGSFTKIATKSPNNTSHSVTGLLPATSYTFHIRAINSADSSAWTQTVTISTQATTSGAISRQVWNNVTTCNIGSIQVNTPPASEGTLSLLQEPSNYSDYFGTRVRGYLAAPENGSYTFYISGDDDCALWLSTSENPADTARIAHFTGWTDPLQWDKFTSTQKSPPVTLVTGKRYYIEVRHVDGNGNDHMAVGWTKPGSGTNASPEVIPGSVLSVFAAPAAPSSLTTTTISSTQIDLSWTDNSDNETGFIIERALANQSNFTQVSTVGAGVNSYACTGLDPNTEYQFRVLAKSYAGNSAYTSNVKGITGQSGDQGGPELSPQLLSFAIYSEDLSVVGQRSIFSGGGAVGSNTLVRADIEANIGGDIVCGGNVELKDRVNIQGDVTCGGTLTKVESAPPAISGTVTEHASVTHVDIPVKPAVVYGTTDITVDFDQKDTLTPGSYKDLTIKRGATVNFTRGVYNFRSVFMDNDATILFDVPMDKTIEVNIETSLGLSDRAVAKFATKGYAPCVKIYTNAYSISFGTDVNLTGILTAPNAAVSINSRDRIEGAVYAKSITLLPDAIVVSNCVDPNGDADGDGIPNLTEMVIGNAPDSGEVYTLMGVPSPAMIDNSREQTVSYDFGLKYPYFPNSRADSMTYPAGSLENESVAPGFTITNDPPAGIRPFDLSGYKPVGNYMSMIGNRLKSGKSMRFRLPLFNDIQPLTAPVSIAYFNTQTSEWNVDDASQDGSGNLISDNSLVNAQSLLAVQAVANQSQVVGYLDNGMIFSDQGKAILQFNGLINATGVGNPQNGDGFVSISYLEHTPENPEGIPRPVVTIPVLNYMGYLVMNKNIVFTNKITVVGISIYAPNFLPEGYTLTKNFVIDLGQTLTFEMNRTRDEMINEKFTGDRISAFYQANSIDFESMAFEEGVIKGNVNSWSYNYYLKDHLGTTRMAIDDQGGIVGAYMYQPYGNVENLNTGSTEQMVRKKFIGKEFDEDGPHYGLVDFDVTLDFILNHSEPDLTKPNMIGVFFSDSPEPEILHIQVDQGTKKGSLKGYIKCPAERTITKIQFLLDNWNTICDVRNINETVGPGSELTISKIFTDESVFQSPKEKDFLNYTRNGEFYMAGVRLDYFGFRYYDPELGTWTSTDPMDAYWNTYCYAGANPIKNIDPLGLDINDREINTSTSYSSFGAWLDNIMTPPPPPPPTRSNSNNGESKGTLTTPTPSTSQPNNDARTGGSTSPHTSTVSSLPGTGEDGGSGIGTGNRTGNVDGNGLGSGTVNIGGGQLSKNNGSGNGPGIGNGNIGGVAGGLGGIAGRIGWGLNRTLDGGEEILTHTADLNEITQTKELQRLDRQIPTYRSMRGQGTYRGGRLGSYNRNMTRLTAQQAMRKAGVESAKKLSLLAKGIPLVGMLIGAGIDVGLAGKQLDAALFSSGVSALVGIGAAALIAPIGAPLAVTVVVGVLVGIAGDNIGDKIWGSITK